MTKPKKISLAILFGGRSGEHEVSICSAASVISALNPAKYTVLPIFVDKDGHWMLDRGFPGRRAALTEVSLSVVPNRNGLYERRSGRKVSPLDVVMPLIHGTYGEDGCLQGLLEVADLAYCGADVLGSAVGMDKAVQKRILRQAGIPVVPWVDFSADRWKGERPALRRQIARLGYPLFVKPANLGSSVGISRVDRPAGLAKAIELALNYDLKVIVEKAVPDAREIEAAVLGPTGRPEVAPPGEIIPSNVFYDYAAKYLDGQSQMVIPAALSVARAERVRQLAARAYAALGASGFARIDFLMSRRTGQLVLNEINTLPGFTEFSMFPKLWEAAGLPYGRLLDRIVRLAVERHRAKRRLSRDFSRMRVRQSRTKKGGHRQ